jgi:branched-chain amino acid transport system ATP-binding protein
MEIIKIKKLTKNFSETAVLNNISLKIKKNEITTLLGANGSGKTTLFNILMGWLEFDSGIIEYHTDKQIRLVGSKKNNNFLKEINIARTFQEIRLFKQMSVLDNILITKQNKSV